MEHPISTGMILLNVWLEFEFILSIKILHAVAIRSLSTWQVVMCGSFINRHISKTIRYACPIQDVAKISAWVGCQPQKIASFHPNVLVNRSD